MDFHGFGCLDASGCLNHARGYPPIVLREISNVSSFFPNLGGEAPPPHFQIQDFYGPLATMDCKPIMGRTSRNSGGVPLSLNGHDQIESWPEIGGGYPLAFYLPSSWDDPLQGPYKLII